MQRIIFQIVLLLLLAACASQDIRQSKSHSVLLSENITFDLLAPDSFGKDLDLVQIAQIETDGNNFELLFYLEISKGVITILAVLPNGTRIFSIVYDGVTIKSEGYSQIVEKLKPRYLLADLQLSLWPIEVLKAKWLDHIECYNKGMCEILVSLKGTKRRLVDGEQDIITINYSARLPEIGQLNYTHHQRNYTIKLETVEQN